MNRHDTFRRPANFHADEILTRVNSQSRAIETCSGLGSKVRMRQRQGQRRGFAMSHLTFQDLTLKNGRLTKMQRPRPLWAVRLKCISFHAIVWNACGIS